MKQDVDGSDRSGQTDADASYPDADARLAATGSGEQKEIEQ